MMGKYFVSMMHVYIRELMICTEDVYLPCNQDLSSPDKVYGIMNGQTTATPVL